jgi:methionine-rich copper-binding protein CopC
MSPLRLRLALLGALVLLGLLATMPLGVSAHAQYASSTPPSNSTIPSLPASLQIIFTQELGAIQIQVLGPNGADITTGRPTIDLEQRHNASVAIRQDTGPGMYSVIWHNVSGEDGDPNDGTFVFTVGSAAAAAPAVAAPAPALPAATGGPAAAVAPTPVGCVDSGKPDPGIHDARVDTYCKRQAIRAQYKDQIDERAFNYFLSIGQGLESALANAKAVKNGTAVGG